MGIEVLLGQTVIEIHNDRELITFKTIEGKKYRMIHHQDCCEDVYVDDITGELKDLLGSPMLMAEVITESTEIECDISGRDQCTWTFYKLATIKGYVTIMWRGESNGHYSEEVDFEEYEEEPIAEEEPKKADYVPMSLEEASNSLRESYLPLMRESLNQGNYFVKKMREKQEKEESESNT